MAYALEESGSLQNTGRASLLGSRVSPSEAVFIGRPTTTRLGMEINVMLQESADEGLPPRVLTHP